VTVLTPTNPKKHSLMPSGALRKALRAAGHHLSPIVQVGKEGVTPAVLAQLDEALGAHELVKLKVGTETPEDRFGVAEQLAATPDTHLAQIIGRVILVYRKHPVKPRFEAAPEPLPDPEIRRKARRNVSIRPPRPTTAAGVSREETRSPRGPGRGSRRGEGEGGRRSGGRGEGRSEGRSGGRSESRSGGRSEGRTGARGEGRGEGRSERTGGRSEGRSEGRSGAWSGKPAPRSASGPRSGPRTPRSSSGPRSGPRAPRGPRRSR
jgi:RNA-binding protein